MERENNMQNENLSLLLDTSYSELISDWDDTESDNADGYNNTSIPQEIIDSYNFYYGE